MYVVKMNTSMRSLLDSYRGDLSQEKISATNVKILEQGVLFGGGVLILKSRSPVSVDSNENDWTGYEASQNYFYVDQEMDKSIPSIQNRINACWTHPNLIGGTLLLLSRVVSLLQDSQLTDAIRVSASFDTGSYIYEGEDVEPPCDSLGSNIKFYINRPHESGYVEEDLESYEQPVLCIDMVPPFNMPLPSRWWKFGALEKEIA